MNVYPLRDIKTIPDIVQEYPQDVKSNHLPLVIDNGSQMCRVGWCSSPEPLLMFKNLIAKPRKDRTKNMKEEKVNPEKLIGNDIVNIEALRFQLRTQFDRNVITHYYIQEQIFDYIFKLLNIDTQGCVDHPIVLTECMQNPNYCRELMSELLFECYNVPAVCFGIDSIFSFNYNQAGNSGLIVSIGFTATHVIPYLNGEHVTSKIRRINIGGYHMIGYLHRLLQLKYPVHVNSITLSRIEEIFHDHCSFACDYQAELKKWADMNYYDNAVKKIQLPFNPIVTAPVLTAEQKTEKRKELSRRLGEINARKREEKLVEDKDTLQKLIAMRELYEEEEDSEFELALADFNLSSYEDMEKQITQITSRIERTQQKISAVEAGVVVEIPEKLAQIIPQLPADKNADEYVHEVKKRRQVILEKKHVRRQRRQDLAKRRTAAAQERMRIISRLAGKEKGTDDFGSRDTDWDVYKAISKEGDSDTEAENEKLIEFEEILRHHDPMYEEPLVIEGSIAEHYQLHVGLEAIRAPEIIFQPSMVGLVEAGLAEVIDYILKMFNENDQQRLVDNIYLTGGAVKIPGIKQRLTKELMEMRPFQSTFNITMAGNASMDAWQGARQFASSPENLKQFQITRATYEEYGGEYVKEYFASNRYFPTPDVVFQ